MEEEKGRRKSINKREEKGRRKSINRREEKGRRQSINRRNLLSNFVTYPSKQAGCGRPKLLIFLSVTNFPFMNPIH